MPRTIGDVVTEARSFIQDTIEPFRYTDADLVMYLNDALVEIRRLRPDFFIGSLATPVVIYTTAQLATNFPIDEQAIPACTYYVAGSASLRDDEHEIDNRTAQLLQGFAAKLTRPA